MPRIPKRKAKPTKKKSPMKKASLIVEIEVPQKDEELEILKGEIQQLLAASHKHSVESRAEVGKRLVASKAMIKHGEWLTWVEENYELDESSAKRAMNLFHLRQSAPKVFAKLAPLGLTKSYQLMTMPSKPRDAFLSKAHVVPSLGVVKTPAQMTFKQMMEVLYPPEPETKETKTKKVIKGLRRQAHALEKLIETLWKLLPGLRRRAALKAALATLFDEIDRVQVPIPKSLIAASS